MPKMGGGEAYGRIRLIRPDIPVIFQTGHDPDTAKSDQRVRLGLPVLRKPYSMHELPATVDELLVTLSFISTIRSLSAMRIPCQVELIGGGPWHKEQSGSAQLS